MHNITNSNSDDAQPIGERNWYLIKDDLFVGPYTVSDLAELALQGKLERQDWLWSEGMPEWQMLELIPELHAMSGFAQVQISGDSPTTTNREPSKPVGTVNGSVLSRQLSESAEQELIKNLSQWPVLEFNDGKRESILESPSLEILDQQPQARPAVSEELPRVLGSNRALWLAMGAVFLVAVGSIIWTAIHRSVNIEGISTSDKRQIASVVNENLLTAGPLVALAINDAEKSKTYFYVGTNLPDGSELAVTVQGIPETLVGAFAVSETAVIAVKKGIAKTPVLQIHGAKEFPVGEYRISVKCHRCSAEVGLITGEVLIEKSYFLGGARDNSYDQQLKRYHELLKPQAEQEREELRQLIEVLESQMNESVAKFEEILALGEEQANFHGAQLWKPFHENWQLVTAQVLAMSSLWSEDDLKYKIFYGKTYSLVKGIVASLAGLHERQQGYILNSKRDKVEAQLQAADLATSASLIRSQVVEARAQLRVADRLPIMSNGMPQRP